MNDALAEKLELTNVREVTSCPMARIGNLKKEMEVKEFSAFAKNKLNINYGLLLNYGKKMIKTVAIIGGGGSKYYKDAMLDGADIYISGDCPHHVRRDIITSNFNYLDLPHEIEKIFIICFFRKYYFSLSFFNSSENSSSSSIPSYNSLAM